MDFFIDYGALLPDNLLQDSYDQITAPPAAFHICVGMQVCQARSLTSYDCMNYTIFKLASTIILGFGLSLQGCARKR